MVGTETVIGEENVCPFSPYLSSSPSPANLSEGSYLASTKSNLFIYYSRFVEFMKERKCFFVKSQPTCYNTHRSQTRESCVGSLLRWVTDMSLPPSLPLLFSVVNMSCQCFSPAETLSERTFDSLISNLHTSPLINDYLLLAPGLWLL